MNYSPLDPLNEHMCLHCQHLMLDIDKGYFCRLTKELLPKAQYPNDCENFKSQWENDYRRRRDLERKIKQDFN